MGSRRRWMVPTFAFSLLLVHGPAPASIEPLPDWVLVTVEATSDVTDLRMVLDLTAVRTSGVGLWGTASASSRRGSLSMRLIPLGGGRHVVTTSDMLGGLVVDTGIDSPTYGSGTLGMRVTTSSLAEGERFYLFSLVTGYEFSVIEASVDETNQGAVSITREVGSGSVALAVTPATGYLGFTAGPAGGGFFEQRAVLSTGIVGGFTDDWECTGLCVYGWDSPDGRRGSYTTAGLVVAGSSGVGDAPFLFAGPSGEWVWRWSGLLTTAAPSPPARAAPVAYGAFAPVGDAWQVF